MLTLVIGAIGAVLFHLIGFPAAFLTGPATAVAIASVVGLRTHVPLRLCDVVFLIIGAQIGSTVTPEVIDAALTWPLSFVVLTLTLVLILLVVPATLKRWFGLDRITAFLASAPGHVTFVLGLSTDMKADVAQVVLIQTMRVFLLTLLVPVLIAFWGIEGTSTYVAQETGAPSTLALVLIVALLLGLLLKRLRVPAPLLLGAMAVSAIGYGSSVVSGIIPAWITISAFVCMGALIGSRFSGIAVSQMRAAFSAGLLSTLLACIVAAIGAYIAALLIGLHPAALFLAFAPGGVEVMAALAIETQLEPALVAAHHVFRLIILGVLLPLFAIRYRDA